MTITVNGEEKEVADGMVLSRLIDELGLKRERLAIEVNQKIVRRSDWDSTSLSDGDKVEIVHFVGGGAGRLAAVRSSS